MTTTFTAGSLVSARGRDWVVLPDSAPDMLVLRPLGGAADDVAAVFPAFEDVRQAEFEAPSAGDLGDALAAGLLRSALRIGFRSGAGPFRSLAGIAVEPRAYQLVPLMMALRQKVVRILISDDVGIGKTIEAGLIASELLAQGSAQRLAVLCSPALAEQWQEELRTKFGIDAELVLASTVSKLERKLDLGQSLFDRHPHVVVSTDFIKSTRHRDDFVKHCPELVIVDEAHTCVAADDGASTQSQLRHELLERIAADADRHLLLVTATPHSGKESSFRVLLGLVRPELATADFESDTGRRLLAEHFVHRKRADVRQFLTTRDGLADDSMREDTAFPSDRYFKDETYRLSPAYRALLDDAIAYASERVSSAGERGKREARIAWWSAIALLRSLVSSPRAAAQTLRTRSAAAQLLRRDGFPRGTEPVCGLLVHKRGKLFCSQLRQVTFLRQALLRLRLRDRTRETNSASRRHATDRIQALQWTPAKVHPKLLERDAAECGEWRIRRLHPGRRPAGSRRRVWIGRKVRHICPSSAGHHSRRSRAVLDQGRGRAQDAGQVRPTTDDSAHR